ncbi:methylamine dehydrogenase accessory protein MauD [Mesorhizobium sp. LHD-90]|uniref:methylamine dehydrogenase accessory protein MauD n=1 Tax=Mesorhizobium sp. LHD-90 TaxID=3071414 RepID=UPI0027E09DD2|nr:methylamine dehydrogenase accessory protein MauD [Mesorhizobium sp. LHD-90]MDQ6434414.1 methylamine dehydrogenase accessory protein MauD [Mesorhizobium sp. LHD-90]
MEPLVVAVIVLWAIVIVLLVVVFALARQVGILFERVAPMGALMTDAGPKIGEHSPRFDLLTLEGKPLVLGPPSPKNTLVFFLSTTCPVCKKLLPVLKSLKQAEAENLSIVIASDGDALEHGAFRRAAGLGEFPYVLSRDLGMAYRINRLPFAVLLDREGVLRGKGLVNSREQLESLLNAQDLGHASIQGWIEARTGERALN